jgi:DEAD/DEAH box helicase domain-containing protein
MRPYLVFDIEIKRTITEVAKELKLPDERMAFAYPQKLGFGVGIIYNSLSDEFLVFKSAREFALYLLKFGGLLVSFNGARFDLPVLLDEIDIDTFRGLMAKPHLDILRDFYGRVEGRFRVGLDNIAKNTIGKSKTGNGADAPFLFQQERWDELIDYCRNDVVITKEIFEFGFEQGYIHYLDTQTGRVCRMEVDWSEWGDEDGWNTE